MSAPVTGIIHTHREDLVDGADTGRRPAGGLDDAEGFEVSYGLPGLPHAAVGPQGQHLCAGHALAGLVAGIECECDQHPELALADVWAVVEDLGHETPPHH